MKKILESKESKIGCVIDKDFEWLDRDKNLKLLEKAQYTQDLMEDIFNEISDYSMEAYKSGYFGRKLADKNDGIVFYLNPGLFQNRKGSWEELTEFFGEDKYGTGYFATPERSFILVRQANTFEVELRKKPHFMVHVTECSVVIAKNDEKIFVSHIGMSYRREVEGVLNYLKKEGFENKSIYVVASVGSYQEKMAKKIDSDRLARVQQYEDLGVKKENILSFEHEMVKDGEDNVHRNTTEVMVTKDFIYKYSFDHRSIGGWFGRANRREPRLFEMQDGAEEREIWDQEVVELI